MNGYLTHLAARAVAKIPAVRPLVHSRYEAAPASEISWAAEPVPELLRTAESPAGKAPQRSSSPVASDVPVEISATSTSNADPVRPPHLFSPISEGLPPREVGAEPSTVLRRPVVPNEKALPSATHGPAGNDEIQRLKVVETRVERFFEIPVSNESRPATPASGSVVPAEIPGTLQPEIQSTKIAVSDLVATPSLPDAVLPFQSRTSRPAIQIAPPRAIGPSSPRTATPISPAPAPQVTITIGRVEIRAAASVVSEASPVSTPSASPRLSLETYLRRSANRST